MYSVTSSHTIVNPALAEVSSLTRRVATGHAQLISYRSSRRSQPTRLRYPARPTLRVVSSATAPAQFTTAEQCPFCIDVGKCKGICRSPQNVGAPEAIPAPELTEEEVVSAQLEALKDPQAPRRHHGLQVIYEFCGDASAMERSRYFGASRDIYQFDHFMATFATTYPELYELRSFRISTPAEELPDGRSLVRAVVEGKQGVEQEFTFILIRCPLGTYKGCWQTHRLLPADSEFLPPFIRRMAEETVKTSS